MNLLKYKSRSGFSINVGFAVSAVQISEAVDLTNASLTSLPAALYRSLDYKTTSAIVGSIFCNQIAGTTTGIINPIEKGHPDIIPPVGESASEAQLRNYPEGLEVKCTIGNIEQGANLRAGQRRVAKLTGISWQAHHREVKELMGLVWDFVQVKDKFLFPSLTAVFYADDLTSDDWGQISGTTGRNTKVTGMTISGKRKMANGWVTLIDDPDFWATYSRVLGSKIV